MRFCTSVATVEQYAALEGVSAAKLTGREATWQPGEVPIIGPPTPAAWAGSEEERQASETLTRWSEHVRRAVWGE